MGGRVGLVTCRDLPEPDIDEALLLDAVGGVLGDPDRVALVAWDDNTVDWASFDLVVVRSTWNYHHELDGFLAWLDATSQVTRVENDPRIMQHNVDKRYLRELELAGIPIVPTIWWEGVGADNGQIPTTAEWARVVVKPVVSAGSYRTVAVERDPGQLGHALSQLGGRPGMIQPYQRAVDDYGERSLVFIDGELSHAVRKQPRFAGQDERVSDAAVSIADEEATFAQRILERTRQLYPGTRPLLYARVDLMADADGAPRLAELELVEPSLFLAQYPSAATRLAEAINVRLHS